MKVDMLITLILQLHIFTTRPTQRLPTYKIFLIVLKIYISYFSANIRSRLHKIINYLGRCIPIYSILIHTLLTDNLPSIPSIDKTKRVENKINF